MKSRRFILSIAIGLLLIGSGVIAARSVWEPVNALFSDNSTQIDPPQTSFELPDQFKGISGSFVFVTKDQAQVYASPNISAKIIETLPRTKRVVAQGYAPEEQNLDDAEFIYLLEEGSISPIGWVKRDDLAFRIEFEPFDYCPFTTITYKKGQLHESFKIKSGGYFEAEWQSEGEGLKMNGEFQGRVYEAKNMLWLKATKPQGWLDFLYLSDSGTLSPEIKFEASRIQSQ